MILHIGTTNRCNMTCGFCFRDELSKKQGVMSDELFSKIVADNGSADTFVLSLYGDPLCDPRIVDRVRHIRTVSDKEIYFHTNGKTLDRSMCDDLAFAGMSRIVISCYGLEKDHELAQAGSDFVRISKMATYMSYLMPVLIVSNRVPGMIAKETDLIEFWEDRGCSVITDSGMEWGDGDTHGGITCHNSVCAITKKYRVFDWDGSMIPCCFDFNGKNTFGDASKEKFEDVTYRLKTMSCEFCTTCPHKGTFDAWRQHLPIKN